LAPAGFLTEVLFEEAVPDELRGDLAAAVLEVLDVVLFEPAERPDVEVERPDLAPPLRPLADVFDRAEAVLRVEDDLEPPLFDDPPREELLLLELPVLLFPREDELPPEERDDPLLPPPDEAFPPLRPAALFCAVLPPRLDELVDDLLLDEEPPLDDLRFVAAPPFLPAALFFAVVLRDDPLDDRELLDDFFAPLLDVFFAPPLDVLRFVAAAPFLPAALF